MTNTLRFLLPQAPQFYDSNVPPAPAGIVWWKYKSGVPPLPDPIDFFNGSSQFSRYGWKYDANYVANDYTFSRAPLCTDNLRQMYASDNAGSQRTFSGAFFALTICTVS